MASEASGACPICRGRRSRRDENPAFPFCGPACRAIDLGRWLGDAYRIPGPAAVDEDDRHASATEEAS